MGDSSVAGITPGERSVLLPTETVEYRAKLVGVERFVSPDAVEFPSTANDKTDRRRKVTTILSERFWEVSPSKDFGIWNRYPHRDGGDLMLLITFDQMTQFSRTVILDVDDSNASPPNLISDHLVHPLTVFRGRNREASFAQSPRRMFWVQDWLDQRAEEPLQVCLQVDFQSLEDATQFTAKYEEAQDRMREGYRYRPEAQAGELLFEGSREGKSLGERLRDEGESPRNNSKQNIGARKELSAEIDALFIDQQTETASFDPNNNGAVDGRPAGTIETACVESAETFPDCKDETFPEMRIFLNSVEGTGAHLVTTDLPAEQVMMMISKSSAGVPRMMTTEKTQVPMGSSSSPAQGALLLGERSPSSSSSVQESSVNDGGALVREGSPPSSSSLQESRVNDGDTTFEQDGIINKLLPPPTSLTDDSQLYVSAIESNNVNDNGEEETETASSILFQSVIVPGDSGDDGDYNDDAEFPSEQGLHLSSLLSSSPQIDDATASGGGEHRSGDGRPGLSISTVVHVVTASTPSTAAPEEVVNQCDQGDRSESEDNLPATQVSTTDDNDRATDYSKPAGEGIGLYDEDGTSPQAAKDDPGTDIQDLTPLKAEPMAQEDDDDHLTTPSAFETETAVDGEPLPVNDVVANDYVDDDLPDVEGATTPSSKGRCDQNPSPVSFHSPQPGTAPYHAARLAGLGRWSLSPSVDDSS